MEEGEEALSVSELGVLPFANHGARHHRHCYRIGGYDEGGEDLWLVSRAQHSRLAVLFFQLAIIARRSRIATILIELGGWLK